MKISKPYFLSLFLGFFLSATLCAQTVYKDYFDGEIYVKFSDEYPVDFSKEFVEPQSLVGLNQELVQLYGITQARFSFNKIPSIKLQRTVRLKFSAIDKVDDLLKHFEQLPFIEYAEKIPAYSASYTPNDFGSNSQGDAWHLYKIKAREAWDYTKGDTTITVAVVDQEFDVNHSDLKNNIWVNPNEIPNNNIDDDNNGYIDDVSGWDISDGDNNVTNYVSSYLNHGTPCAGLVAATTDNSNGVAAIGFNIKIIPVKVCRDNQTDKYFKNPDEGILYASTVGADIISCSFGGAGYSTTTQNLINFVSSLGSIVVASAGNESTSDIHYPAGYQNVITVAASDINDNKASFSNFGSWIDISAPGVATKTTYRNNSYLSFTGTSGSCPITAGLLALMKSQMPTILNSELTSCLINNADNIDNLNPIYVGQLGSGRINAEKAMKCVDSIKKSPPVLNISTNNNYICPHQEITLTANSYKRQPDSVVWYIYKRDTIEKYNGQQIGVSFERDSAFDIAAVVYDGYGKDSLFLSQYIQVSSLYSNVFYFEDFESAQPNIKILNPNADNVKWRRANAPKTNNSANNAFKINFSDFASSGDRDAFITPVFDLSRAVKARLYFQHAYYNNNLLSSKDSLIVYASIDSGQTFPYKMLAKVAADLNTSTRFVISGFEPIDNNDWCIVQSKCVYVALDSLVGEKNVALKFETNYDKGNNLFIDDIKVYSLCSDVINFKPTSKFLASDTIICQNSDIQFEAKSTSFPKDYMWVFEGGIPDTSYLAKPLVNYTQTGTYDVTLISSNVLGSDTLYLKDYITCLVPPKVILSDTVKYVCNGDSVYFTASGTDSIQWYKHNTKQTIYDSIMGDRPVQNTLYSVKAITPEGCYDSTTVRSILVPLPPAVFINKDSNKLVAQHNPGSFVYRWYRNDTLASEYTTATIQPKKTGTYKVEIVDSAGCSSFSNNTFFEYITIGIEDVAGNPIKVYPNPANSSLYVSGIDKAIPANAVITDVSGRKVLETSIYDGSIDISKLSAGLYFITISQNELTVTRKIRVE